MFSLPDAPIRIYSRLKNWENSTKEPIVLCFFNDSKLFKDGITFVLYQNWYDTVHGKTLFRVSCVL